MAGYHASSKENKVQIGEIKAMCFLIRADQKRYSLPLKKLRDGYNVGRDEYPVTTTLALDLLIQAEGGIRGNQKISTYKNCSNRGVQQNKERMGHNLINIMRNRRKQNFGPW